MKIVINPEKCVHCGLCASACPAHLFRQEGTSPAEIPSDRGCIGCGHCVCFCPAHAVAHDDFPPEKQRPVTDSDLNWEEFYKVIQQRRSVRHFQKKPVPREMLQHIVEAAQLAPTACNHRDVQWVAVTNSEILSKVQEYTLDTLRGGCNKLKTPLVVCIAKLFPKSEAGQMMPMLPFLESVLKLADTQDVVLFDAPAVLFAHYAPDAGRYAEIDAQLALQNAALAAVAQGLGTFYTGFVVRAADSDPRFRTLLNIPADRKIAGGMTVGYPAVKYHSLPVREYPPVEFLE